MARTMRIIGVSVCALACVLGPDPASLARADSAASIPPWSTYQQPGTSVVLDSAQRYAGKPTLRIAISADVGPPHSTQRRQSNAVWLLDATPYRAKRVRLQLDDLTTFDRDVATARVIGLGQASAGTAEFLRMKHRLFRDLVERHGVTVLAFDTGVVEAREIDRYVATGRGDPIRALRSLPTWEWQTAEVRDLVKWMRAFNAAPGLHPTLHFAGVDPKLVDRALSNVESFAAKRGAHVQAAVRKQYACMPRSMESWQRLSATWDGKPRCIRSVAEVSRLIATLHPDVDLAHDAHVVEQGVRIWLDPHGNGWGDVAVAQAENIAWLAATRYPGAKVAVWSDNRAIGSQRDADRPADWPTLGSRLNERFGKGYVRIGFAFDRGAVSATNDRLGPTSVAPAPRGTMEELLNSVGTRFYVPLRSLRASDPAARWFEGDTLGREVPSWFVDSSAALVFARWKQRSRFDALIFVSESHASAVFPSLLGPLHYPARYTKERSKAVSAGRIGLQEIPESM